MTYNPNHLVPPEISPRDVVTCDQCGDDVGIDQAVNVGTDDDPTWICEGSTCMKHQLIDVTADNWELKHRCQRLVETVTHGIGSHGHRSHGRWNISKTVDIKGPYVVLESNGNGSYLLIELAGELE